MSRAIPLRRLRCGAEGYKDNLPIKKPWTVATTHEGIGKVLSEFQCSCNMQHAEGRGKFLRETQSYTYMMTDAIHAAHFVAAFRALKLLRLVVLQLWFALPL